MTVEFTAQYATSVADLTAAWAFVMERIDQVGPDPSVVINPKWRFRSGDKDGERFFEVVVSGMVEAK
jgi:hypothetical protein